LALSPESSIISRAADRGNGIGPGAN
jgi:hypothetical protein